MIDIDSDDGLIGSQVFNTLNAVYSSEENEANPWLVYSNFVIVKKNIFFYKGFSKILDIPVERYRHKVDYDFRTSHLKTYKAKL